MKIKFISQTISNFKAFTGRHEIVWDSPGLNLIVGENELDKELIANGAGKSTLFDAWCWCLFGKSPRGLRNPEVLPWVKSDGEGTWVSQQLEIDGYKHQVKRAINPNRLLFNDGDIDQDKLEAKLGGLNFELATNTVLLAQEKPLFFDRTPEKKMELFVDTIDLERWDKRSALAADKRDVSQQQIDKLAGESKAARAALDTIANELKEAVVSSTEWGKTQDKMQREGELKIKELTKQLEKLQYQFDTADLAEDGAETELKALQNQASKMRDEYHSAVQAADRAEAKIDEARRNMQDRSRALTALDHVEVCPTCGQPVRPADMKKHRQELKDEISRYAAIIDAGIPVELSTAVAERTKCRDAVVDHILEFTDKRDEAAATIKRVHPELIRLHTELKHWRTAVKDDAVNPFFEQIRRLRALQEDRSAELKTIFKELNEAEKNLERYKIWTRGFKDIKLQLVDEVLDELEIVSNGLLADVGLAGWKIRYDIEKELKSGDTKRMFNVEISSPESRGFVKWESWSGGEVQRLKLIGAIALSDVLLARAGIEANLEILDEPAKYWAAASVENLTTFLSDRARQTGKSIFLVEHQAAESAHFRHTMMVVKDGQGAFIAKD